MAYLPDSDLTKCEAIVALNFYSCALLPPQQEDFVRPGFELGFKENGKYYIYNHLVFNVLVHKTHGEYTAARKKYGDAVAEGLDARKLLGKRRCLRPCSPPHIVSRRDCLLISVSLTTCYT